jgi:hypothetical protein
MQEISLDELEERQHQITDSVIQNGRQLVMVSGTWYILSPNIQKMAADGGALMRRLNAMASRHETERKQ